MQTLFERANLFDGFADESADAMSVLVADGIIQEVSEDQISAPNAMRIDCTGRTLMPGLIDLHIHAIAADVNLTQNESAGAAYRTAHAVRMLGHSLDCGFTTVRDVGGGDWSLWRACEDGLIRAPRFFYAGKFLSMTGGHGDMRPASHEGHRHEHQLCGCCAFDAAGVLADGVDECIKAAREQLRRGAHCIKIMGSGGVASPSDPIWMNQYREDEIRAIVGEATERRSYVTSHCHPAEGIRRAVSFGVRCIEHGTLMDAETAAYVVEHGAYVVPTLVILFSLIEHGERLGFPAVSMAKAREVSAMAMEGLDHSRTAGVKLGFGTDLLGDLYTLQCREFTLRREVFSNAEILRQATSGSAEILQRKGMLGCVTPGAHADLLLVDGDPLADIGLLSQNGERLDLIMRGGQIVKDRITH